MLIGILVRACICDIRHRKVPNYISTAGWLISFVCHIAEQGRKGFWCWLAGGSIPFLIYLVLYILKAVGAGDVKLISAAGSFLGGRAASFLSVGALAAGAAASLIHLIRQRRLICHLQYLAEYFHTCYLHRRIMPFGGRKGEVIPFTVCILAAVLLWLTKEGGTVT